MKISPKGLFLFLAAFIALPLAAADLPRPSPELAIATPDGKQVFLSQYRGKVVALEFLLTSCPSCQRTSQLMNRLSKEYGPRGFQALGAAFNPDAHTTVPGFIKQFRVEYPVGAVSRETAFAYLQRSVMMRTSVPILVLIGRDGVIRAQYTGDDAFFTNEEKNARAIIEKLLEEPTAANSRRKAAARKSS